ncbi:exopolygalacturonase-like [Vigna unguiculata]|uniref:exopolygalacturonase-like n=1 Tax=Vigna unguiculata TaxID=3917 RepID=UPI00101600EA|nr:exopolygalacturonase-like [Vigna unguiculata]
MAMTERLGVLIMYFALVSHVGAVRKVMPVAVPDIFKNKNVAHDKLLPGERIYNVRSFGAIPDGKSDCTEAFMNAWRATCDSTEQARLLVPEGRFLLSSMFFAGPCSTPEPVTIQVVGTIVAPTDLSEYVDSEWLLFEDMDGIKLLGGGTFDGVGMESWLTASNCVDIPFGTCIRNPASIYFHRIKNGIIQNIKSINPKGFHIFVTNCANIRLRRLKLTAPNESPNTDGIHISHSIGVRVAKNTIETGDDCISIIHGSHQVSVYNVNCGPGHGISIGSLGKYEEELEVKGIRVRNVSMVGTQNGLRIKTWPDLFPGHASDIIFSDITMQNVRNPIVIDQEYQCSSNCEASLVQIKNVIFSNIKGTTATPIAVDLRCSNKFPCETIQLENIDLSLSLKSKPSGSRCANIKPIYKGMQNPQGCL